jgi:excisionase family DNA binding protein
VAEEEEMRSGRHDAITPTDRESLLARRSLEALTEVLEKKNEGIAVSFGEGKEKVGVELPSSALRLLKEILSEMAEGKTLTLLPIQAELTTQEAADYLQVSRPFLVKLLDAGEIAHHLVGSHRRIRIDDLVEYQVRMKRRRGEALDELTAEAQRLNLGY